MTKSPYKTHVTSAMVLAFTLGAAPHADDKVVESNFDYNFTPDGRELVYYSYKGRTLPDIYKKTDDGPEINLTKSDDIWDIEPDYSPDGKSIAFSSGDSMAVMNLHIMNADGSHNRLLLDLEDSIIGPAWSPSGEKIAFSTFVAGSEKPSGDVYIVNADGTGLKNLTHSMDGSAIKPEWSPGGDYIYFMSGTERDGAMDIYRMDSEGGHLSRLTDFSESGLQAFDVKPTPDGDTLVFTGTNKEGSVDIYAIRADLTSPTSEVHQITDTADAKEYFLSFTPNGHHLTYSKGEWETGFSFAHIPTPNLGHQ